MKLLQKYVHWMPLNGGDALAYYDYRCDNCEHIIENHKQSIKEDALVTCPHCLKPELKRIISNTAFVLKGSGWAADNYSSPKAKSK